MTENVAEALKGLNSSLSKSLALTAWLELEKSEKSEDFERSFRMGSDTEQELRCEIGAFVNDSFQVHDALQSCGEPEQARLQKRYRVLQKRFHNLRIPVSL